MEPILTFDIGGTNLRFAVICDGQILEQKRISSPNFLKFPGKSGKILADVLVKIICKITKELRNRHPAIGALSLAMPGMVTEDGVVVSAPPLWGEQVANFPLRDAIRQEIHLATAVFNDLCGPAIYHSQLPEFAAGADFLTLITLSTGIGSRTVDLKRKILITDSLGRCGEIGHVNVSPPGDPLPCDCGGKGHLSSYLSGRGLARLIGFMAAQYPGDLQKSRLRLVADEELLLRHFVKAVKSDDPFALQVLNLAVEKFAGVLQIVATVFGIDRFVIIGSLAFALGDILLTSVTKHLKRIGIFGYDDGRLDNLIKLGVEGDEAALLGAAQYGALILKGAPA